VSRQEVFETWAKNARTGVGDDGASHALARPGAVVVAPASGRWRVAVARVDVTADLFRRPSGWSLRAERSSAWVGHLFARLCLLEAPDGQRLLWLHLDALVGSAWITEALGRELATMGVDAGRIFTSCTHGHAAPGNVSGDCFYDTMADGSLQGFDQVAANRLVDLLSAAARALPASLEPATLHMAAGLAPHGALWQRALAAYLAQFGDPSTMSAATVRDRSRREIGRAHV